MIINDPLLSWAEPEAIRQWGDDSSPPLKDAWIDYINYFVHPDVACIVGRLLLPAFIEHDGGVFLKSSFRLETFERWSKTLKDLEEIEKVINHRHVYDMFSFNKKIDGKSYINIAQLMARTTEISLKNQFPGRNFNVFVSATEDDYGPIVCFHSIKESIESQRA